MPLRKRKKNEPILNADNSLLTDIPRGVEGRIRTQNWLPHQYFENSSELVSKHNFTARTDEIFLGVTDGQAKHHQRHDGRKEYLVDGGQLIGSKDDRHLLTIAGSRSGKGRSAIIPNLLTYGGSVFTIDPKGENALLTAKHRAEVLGQEVCIIDPFGLMPEELQPYVKRFNPLSILTFDSPTIVEDAGLIASSLITRDQKDSHWSDTAQAFVEGVILHVATDYQFIREERTLASVYDLIACKILELDALYKEMMDNPSLGGRIAAAAKALDEKGEAEAASVISTVRRNLKFLDYDSVRACLDDNDFELDDLKRKTLSIYVCLPVMRMSTCSALLRVMVNVTMAAMEKNKVPLKYPVLMILDEFPVLGYMPDLEMAIGYMAGFGVKLWIFLQDLSQLKALYNKRWETFIGNSGVIQAFGNSELSTTEFLSKRLGQTTMTITNQGAVSRDQRHYQGATGYEPKPANPSFAYT